MKQRALFALGVLLLLTACGHVSQRPAGSEYGVQLPPRPDHVVIVFMENKDYDEIIGSSDAPYINSLAAQGASLQSFYAFHHPSQPNYFEFFAGQSEPLGVCTDVCPDELFDVPNLGANALANNISFIGYAEELPPPDQVQSLCDQGSYARRHCPWTYFSNVPVSRSQDFSTFPTTAAGYATLPQIAMVIPDLDNDMHDGTVQQGDTWLQQHLDGYVQWAKTNNSLLILTWDENSESHRDVTGCPGLRTRPPRNHIATLIVGANVSPGATSTKEYNHYNLLRTVLDLYGLAPFAGAAGEGPIDDIWTGVTVDRSPATSGVASRPSAFRSPSRDPFHQTRDPIS